MSQIAPTMMILDGKDFGELGLIISRAPGWRGIPATRRKSVRLAGRHGNVAVSGSLEISPRIVVIEGTLVQDTLAERKASEDEIGGRLAVAQVARFIDNNDRYMSVDVGEYTTIPMAAPFSAAEIGIRIQLTANDPLIYETSLTNVTFTVTKDNCPLGNMPVRPLITINGAVTNPSIIYRDSGNNIIQQMDITATVAGGDRIEIDSAQHTVIHYISSTPNNIIDDISGPFIVLDPNDANDQFASSPTWPTLECTPTASCEADYQKAYAS